MPVAAPADAAGRVGGLHQLAVVIWVGRGDAGGGGRTGLSDHGKARGPTGRGVRKAQISDGEGWVNREKRENSVVTEESTLFQLEGGGAGSVECPPILCFGGHRKAETVPEVAKRQRFGVLALLRRLAATKPGSSHHLGEPA